MTTNQSSIAGQSKQVFTLGATGTIGQATVRAFLRRGHDASPLFYFSEHILDAVSPAIQGVAVLDRDFAVQL